MGAVTNTFNVPGVTDHCFFLKTAEDAKAIRERVNACFELANLPESTEEDRKRLLSFVVVGSNTYIAVPQGIKSLLSGKCRL